MKSKTKLLFLVLICGGLFALAAVAAVSAVLLLPWGQSAWSQVPDPTLFVTTEPKRADIAGVYQLTEQTITTTGLTILQGRQCELDLRPDGSFTVTNYPRWSPDSNRSPFVAGFTSTTGRWHCSKLGLAGKNLHPFWGVEFSETDNAIASLAFRGKVQPYSLMMTYGDGDAGMVMLLERKK